MPDCTHEEADTRMCIHVHDALQKGAHDILVRTVDTVILVGQSMLYIPISIWVGFGTGKHFRYYSINVICQQVGEQKSRALPYFRAFTGCDTTSQFFGRGKKSAWECWKSYPEATEAFQFAADHPFELQLNSRLCTTGAIYILWSALSMIKTGTLLQKEDDGSHSGKLVINMLRILITMYFLAV